MTKIKILMLTTIFLIIATFKVSSGSDQGGPFYFWKGVSRKDISIIKDNYQSEETQKIIHDYSKSCDLLSPLRAGDRISPLSKDWNFRSHLYPYFRAANKDIYLLEYACPRNFAGNIFGKESLPEEWYLHDPVDDLRKEARMVNFWVTLNKTDVNAYNPWVYDMGNPQFVDFFAKQVVRAMQAGLDGLWIDNAGIRRDVSKMNVWETGYSIVPTNPRTGKKYTRAEELAEKLNMAKKIREAVNGFNNGNSLQGRPFLLSPNIGNEILDDEWAIVKAYGAVQSEGKAWFAPGNKVLKVDEWLKQVQTVQHAMHSGVPWLYMGKRETVPWPGKSRILFTYASALLCAGANGDLFFMRYNNALDWTGFHIDIGYATGYFYKYPGAKNIYARKFEKALVLVNPSNENETVGFKFSYQRFLDESVDSDIKWKGLSKVSSIDIQIPAYSAEILILEKAMSAPTGFRKYSTGKD